MSEILQANTQRNRIKRTW